MSRETAVVLVVEELLQARIRLPSTNVHVVVASVSIDITDSLCDLCRNGCSHVTRSINGNVTIISELDAIAVLCPSLLSLTFRRVSIQTAVIDSCITLVEIVSISLISFLGIGHELSHQRIVVGAVALQSFRNVIVGKHGTVTTLVNGTNILELFPEPERGGVAGESTSVG